MTVKAPACLKCKYFISNPKCIGGKAQCKSFVSGIPNNIFYEGGKCGKFHLNTPTKKG